jgi:hypothetical protein
MLECVLLLHQASAKWFPLIAIPVVMAGVVASMCLILSGIKGIISERIRPKRKVPGVAHLERAVLWIAPSGHRRRT